jgi:Domain of unknown function DUF302
LRAVIGRDFSRPFLRRLRCIETERRRVSWRTGHRQSERENDCHAADRAAALRVLQCIADQVFDRIKRDIAAKGILIFMALDQSKLASDAGIKLRLSTLLVFGNPPLGPQFLTSNPYSWLDWPVRLLVTQDEAAK